MQSNNQSHKRISDYLTRLNKRMFNCLQAFYIWKHQFLLSDINTHGEEEAQKNVAIINRYKNFFVQSQQSNLYFFVLEVAKFFDTQQKALTIKKVKNVTLQEKNNLTAEAFLEANPDRELIESLVKSYRGLNKSVFDKIEDLIIRNNHLIEEIKNLRHLFAHDFIDDSNKFCIPSFERIEALFYDIQEIINALSNGLQHSVTLYSHVEAGVKRDLENIIKKLSK